MKVCYLLQVHCRHVFFVWSFYFIIIIITKLWIIRCPPPREFRVGVERVWLGFIADLFWLLCAYVAHSSKLSDSRETMHN